MTSVAPASDGLRTRLGMRATVKAEIAIAGPWRVLVPVISENNLSRCDGP